MGFLTDSPLGEHSISACLVVRNEEAVIERCLQSLSGVVDEIVLVHDGECEDRTLEIAERFGCRTFVRPFVGHAEATTVFAFEQLRGEWIMSLDADEFLGEELREGLRELVRDPAVNGYELLWRMWDGQRYITDAGPFKLALFRRANVHVLGVHHSPEQVDPPVKRIGLQLEHRPAYNNYSLRTVLTKWRRSAKVHGFELTRDFAELPKFNWVGPEQWPWQRRVLNRLSPLLVLAYPPLLAFLNFRRERGFAPGLRNLRLSIDQGIYAGMVQLYVAKYVYLGGSPAVAAEPPRPGAAA
ncbi:MAG TPA: glycosyltransferase [Solirubrobacteraceae bacterium]|nr:glycosyltransferase [Solirubrobacteraceae bacterium]